MREVGCSSDAANDVTRLFLHPWLKTQNEEIPCRGHETKNPGKVFKKSSFICTSVCVERVLS